jgi:hypothetical protein
VGVELRRWGLESVHFGMGLPKMLMSVRRLIFIGWSYVRGNVCGVCLNCGGNVCGVCLNCRGNVCGVCLNCRGTFLVFGICVRLNLNLNFKRGK